MDWNITGYNKNLANSIGIQVFLLYEKSNTYFSQNYISPDNTLLFQYMCLICIYIKKTPYK